MTSGKERKLQMRLSEEQLESLRPLLRQTGHIKIAGEIEEDTLRAPLLVRHVEKQCEGVAAMNLGHWKDALARRSSPWVAVFAVGLCLPPSLIAQNRLALQRVATVDIPVDAPRQQVTVEADLSTVLWSTEDTFVDVWDGTAWSRLALPPGTVPAFVHLLRTDPTILGILDKQSLSYMTLANDGRVTTSRPVTVPAEAVIKGAAMMGSRLLILLWDAPSGSLLLSQSGPDIQAGLSELGVYSKEPRVQVSASSGKLVIADVGAPFLVRVFEVGTGQLQIFEEPEGHLARSLDSLRYSSGLWGGMRAFSLDSGYVQTISDLRSDTRLLVTYDSHGRVKHTSAVNAPIGFVGASANRSILLGVVDTQPQELWMYAWRWVSAPDF